MTANVVRADPLFSLSFVYEGFSCVCFDVPVKNSRA